MGMSRNFSAKMAILFTSIGPENVLTKMFTNASFMAIDEDEINKLKLRWTIPMDRTRTRAVQHV